MTMPEDPPLRSPKRTPDLASWWRTGGGGGSVSWNIIKLPLLFFSSGNWIYSIGIRSDGATWAPWGTRVRQGGGAPWCLVGTGWPPSSGSWCQYFLYIPQKFSKNFHPIPRTLIFCTKTTPWQFCWKQRQSGLVPFKSCKLGAKTRAKVFGNVDTMETYQLPQA